ncbi:His-Xaa-Ser system radical SAM maturase HxsB [Rhodobacteraceae bacterium RKSG542]|uniref:His-Xaa-Ser system radical SAM maturase HxsB n=1 Tax=Pseudovibrio flavus TaxID=2529854 RepID=UPI0012BC8F10|nr:His-Xaa-Ser system radical SAM maturase HxsB [Pseudovibrio flavus]MTI15769.1 His-Xaa-Ser system radical SAM maturase HxsB [Pseudovibrio flavus]
MFMPRSSFEKENNTYQFLPFRFERWGDNRFFLSNEVGEFTFLGVKAFRDFINQELCTSSVEFKNLSAKHFLFQDSSTVHLDLLASKYRTKRAFLDGFTKLHIFVTTLRCNQSCPYCQVSRKDEQAAINHFDMSVHTLRKSIELMLSSPAPHVTMEFQGGEPLLNFELIRQGVEIAKELNQSIGKEIDFVICTNLVTLTDEHLDFCEKEGVLLSTSLDGPEALHNRNRPFQGGGGSYDAVVRGIRRAQEALGKHSVSALMTTTRHSLEHADAIVDEYLKLDMGSIFIRELNPYGFAIKTANSIGYSSSEFVQFYKKVFERIIEVNRQGRTFSEAFASLILTKVLTPWPIGFVDLQSPAGAGLGVVVYNYDGDVYTSDEGRMLAEAQDTMFRMGNVHEDDYDQIFFGEKMQEIAAASCNEALAGCSDCAFQNYCGADPVRNHRTQHDMFGHRAKKGTFCDRNKPIIRYLIETLDAADADLQSILWAWIRREDVNDMQVGKIK